MERFRPQIEQIVADSFSGLRDGVEVDLVREVAWRVPNSVISAILGFKQQWEYVSEVTEEWMVANSDQDNPQRAKEAAAAVERIVKEERTRRVGKPAEDILGEIVSDMDGESLPFSELQRLTNALIIAGHSTTVDGIVNTVHRVPAVPGLFDRLKSDRSILPRVIDESLRINPPAWNMARTARTPVNLRGVEIHAGEKVMLTFRAGNYDPEHFEQPEAFAIGRPGVHGHLTFGYGRHRCVGERLAKLEIQVFVEHILDHFPDLELSAEPTPKSTFSTYGHREMLVRRPT